MVKFPGSAGLRAGDPAPVNGIMDLEDLSKTSVNTLNDILDRAGSRYTLADPSTWPEQAALGARGDWQAMEKLKDELKGGRRK